VKTSKPRIEVVLPPGDALALADAIRRAAGLLLADEE